MSITIQDLESQLARCDREIAEMYAQPPTQPAWLTTLGILDWEAERRIIMQRIEAFNATSNQ